MSHVAAYIVAVALLLPGIAMSFVPLLPGLGYMFVVSLAYAIFDRFQTLSWPGLLILLAIALVSMAVDHFAGALGAKYAGAHAKSVLWGFLGAIAGTLFLPAIGSLGGLFFAVLFAELYYKRHHVPALKAAVGALVGSAAGIAANVALSIGFLVAFVLLAWK